MKERLEALPTVGSVEVLRTLSANASDGTLALELAVTFTLGGSPLNQGSLPLLQLDTAGLAGLARSGVTTAVTGLPQTNYTYEEQAVHVSADALGLAAQVVSLEPIVLLFYYTKLYTTILKYYDATVLPHFYTIFYYPIPNRRGRTPAASSSASRASVPRRCPPRRGRLK